MLLREVILVDERDHPMGTGDKMAVHEQGLLHRAFSVFIFNGRGELLLQRRAIDKYHCGGLWTNTCCSHPAPGEDTAVAAHRRLAEEMGFTAPLRKIFDFVYKAGLDNGLTEYEFDHVFTGFYDGPSHPDPAEVMEYAYRTLDDLRQSLEAAPDLYTPWFRLAFPRVEQWWLQQPAAGKTETR